jgi:hypothetical protein
MNFLKGYRTLLFNTATIIASLAEIVGAVDVVAPGSGPAILLAAGIANVVLRYLTDTAVGTNTAAAETI